MIKLYMLLPYLPLLSYRYKLTYNHKHHKLIKMDNLYKVLQKLINIFLQKIKYIKYKHYKMEPKYKLLKIHIIKIVHLQILYGFIKEYGE